MKKTDLAKKIYEVAHLTGQFKLRSGLTSNEYFDKYRFEARPEILSEIANQLAPLIPKDTEILAGLEMGGIPIATALSLKTGIPCLFVRKKAKDYGTCQFAEGLDFKNKKITIIEDVITTGGQVVLSTQDLRQAGGIVENVLCVIHRSQGSEDKLANSQLKLSALFNKSDFDNL